MQKPLRKGSDAITRDSSYYGRHYPRRREGESFGLKLEDVRAQKCKPQQMTSWKATLAKPYEDYGELLKLHLATKDPGATPPSSLDP